MTRPKLPSLTRTDYTRGERLVALGICLLVALISVVLYALDQRNLQLSLSPETTNVSLLALDDRVKFSLFRDDIEHDVWATLSKVREKFVVVAIDEYSLAEMNWTWPIDRIHYGELVKNLADRGATTIGLDILFENPSQLPASDVSLKKTLARPEVVLPYRIDFSTTEPVLPYAELKTVTDDEFLERNGFTQEWSDLDGLMRKAILTITVNDHIYYSWDVIIAARITKQKPADLLAGLTGTESTDIEMVRAGRGVDARVKAHVTFAPVRFASPGRANNNADLIDESEQGKELLPGIYKSEDKLIESETHTTLDRILVCMPASMLWRTVEQGGMIGMDDQGLIGVETGPDHQPLIDPATGKPKFIECAALVGVTASSGFDLKATPVGKMSGLEMHAYTIGSLLLNSFFRTPPPFVIALYFFLCSLLAGLLISTLGFRAASLGLLVCCGLSILGTRLAYLHSVNWPLIPPLLCMGLSFLLVNIAHVVSRNKRIAQRDERIRVVQNIIRELTPVDIEDLLQNNGLALGGKATDLTVLFSDLRGYTSMAEKLQSVEVIDRLNDYFALLGPILERFGGAVFDYQGDALMAVFGLKPNSQPNHAAAGCKAAAGIIYELEKQRKEWLKQGRPMPETGIGLCTGLVAFGGLGTAQHKQYVAIGDPTNTASRMQGKSKELDSPVLITESTYEMALKDEDVVMRYLEEIELKGKREPLKVYEVSVDETAFKLKIAPAEGSLAKPEPII